VKRANLGLSNANLDPALTRFMAEAGLTEFGRSLTFLFRRDLARGEARPMGLLIAFEGSGRTSAWHLT
jgi:hypothetical protein